LRVALVTTFAASRKEPLLTMMDRVHHGFVDAGVPEPTIRFNFGDRPIPGGVSSIDRVLKRHPELERFVTTASPMPGIPETRRISNGAMSAAAGESIPYATLQAIAAGVPRSFPFHTIALHFYSPEFGEQVATPTQFGGMMTGIRLSDSWWVNGRNRSLSACTVVEAEPGKKKLPPQPTAVATILAACGKARKTVQAPLAEKIEAGPVPAVRLPTGGTMIASADPEAAKAVHAVVADYRARLPEIVGRAAMPHDLPTFEEMISRARPAVPAGPKKPALDRVFKPMGYTVRGESKDFVVRRRTASNLTVELSVSIGGWGTMVMAMFRVWGLGFKALLSIPPSAKVVAGGQYPIGDADQWQKIAENLGALVAELDRTLVPAIEAAAGPSPEWYKPES
jgi:hypothetical protein